MIYLIYRKEVIRMKDIEKALQDLKKALNKCESVAKVTITITLKGDRA